jgi:hypothetical protein
MEEGPVIIPPGDLDIHQVGAYVEAPPQPNNDTLPVETRDPAPPVLQAAETPQEDQDGIPADHIEYMRQLEQQNASLKNTVNQLEMQNATGNYKKSLLSINFVTFIPLYPKFTTVYSHENISEHNEN